MPHQLFSVRLVCLPSDPHAAEGLLSNGWREAGAHDTISYALHVETPQESVREISARDFGADNVNLAIDLGAEITRLRSQDVGRTIIDFAHQKWISRIILKRQRISFWSQLYHHSIVEKLFREARSFDVEVVSDEL